ncbi:DNA repair protein RadA [Candidatus Gracilibacteria bacterium]|nr:DNA repair protein RadA [Candidatus Gracilibacteria bacterium]
MYICSNCGNESLIWKGQCDFCKSWNTLKEFKESKEKKGVRVGEKKSLALISSPHEEESRIITTSIELNTVLGGGIVLGSVMLLSGEPGIGKSTLSLQLANWIHEEIIYISGEETLGQLRSRAKRLNIEGGNIEILTENILEDIFTSIEGKTPKVVIWDSISVLMGGEISGTGGSVSQVRYIAEKIVEYSKARNITSIIIGHVTKDGSLAGPKTLEHMVDTVLYFEGEKYDDIRMLRCLKNRFGATHELGLYKMTEEGLHDLDNPALELLSGSEGIGLALGITIEGRRALIVETEALTNYTKFGYPKRSSRGIPQSKLDLIIAVLSKYTPVKLESYDVYANISRGIKVEEPGLDLALAMSIISSKLGKTLPKSSVFIGEISLTGQIKSVMLLEKRIKEALKLGFTEIYIPHGSKEKLTASIDPKELTALKDFLHIKDIIAIL